MTSDPFLNIHILTHEKLNILVHSYTTLVKDKELVSAEVMNEYNEGVRRYWSWLLRPLTNCAM